MDQQPDRDRRAAASLTGLSVADAYGNQFFARHNWGAQRYPGALRTDPVYREGHTAAFVAAEHLPSGPWPWTDDSEMACGIVAELRRHGRIDPDSLVAGWAEHFQLPRDYGGSALDILYGVRDGGDWRGLSSGAFEGAGSLGNGAAMRIAPLGAWFADDLKAVVTQARIASEVTHMHVDGVAGGIAVAMAAALAAGAGKLPPSDFIEAVAEATPEGTVRHGLRQVLAMPAEATATDVATMVGNGRHISAADTVPLCIWVAARHRDDYPTAVRSVVSAGGDMDTTAAIVGGIVASGDPAVPVPPQWIAAREPLPEWVNPA